MAKRSSDEAQEASKQRKIDAWCKQRSISDADLVVAEKPTSVATPLRAEDLKDAASLRLKGTMRMDVRVRKAEPEVVLVPDSDEEIVEPKQKGVLRISAGRCAAVAGIHRYADVGEIFLELLYQDAPELLVEDARLAGVEVVSPQLERERLIEKSGRAVEVSEALQAARQAQDVDAAQKARERLRELVTEAKELAKLSEDEAAELQQTLELEVNLDFGARHEDSAIERYQRRVSAEVYGQQHRVFLAMPEDSSAALQSFPAPFLAGPRPRGSKTQTGGKPLFYLTGFVDGMVDVRRGSAPPVSGIAVSPGAPGDETLVVEVKHRMGRIKDPPDVYDVVQLCSYCRALGCLRGDLVQCLKKDGDVLHVTRIDFAEGSPDRLGFDQHVVPKLYAAALAVYGARKDQPWRLRLLRAAPEERQAIIGEICPHLDG